MKKHYFIVFSFAVFCFSCGRSTGQSAIKDTTAIVSLAADTFAKEAIVDTSLNFNEEESFANYEVIVIDTNKSYKLLNQKMFSLKEKLGMTIDSMGRYYNAKKDLIVLPENDEDEMYAGEYFPRRELSKTLSLEYMNQYQPNSKPKTIGIIAGIYANALEADSALTAVKQVAPNAFKLHSKLYIGCMH